MRPIIEEWRGLGVIVIGQAVDLLGVVDVPSLSEAIRRLVELGLKAKAK
jgi:hypothetical protein